jgi:hypothetical protein
MLRHRFRMCFEVVDSHTFGIFSVSQYLSLLLALNSNESGRGITRSIILLLCTLKVQA